VRVILKYKVYMKGMADRTEAVFWWRICGSPVCSFEVQGNFMCTSLKIWRSMCREMDTGSLH